MCAYRQSTIVTICHKVNFMSSDDIYIKFAFMIKDYRKKHNLSQEQLAEICNVDRTYIGRIENLKRKPKLGTAYIIIKALNLDVNLLFES